ncbi:M42 family peptidase [candidate division WOR-3 bacterium]|jgi:endoglucanase|nr:M42 family peptidase [candidate division WOR-3 bacterium]
MLKELSELIGVSGGERKVREFIRNTIQNDVSEIIEDPYGNLIVRKGKETTPKILLAAHMDEVGFMISGIEDKGLLRFKAIGMSSRVLLAKRILIGKNGIPGVIGHKPVHLTKKEEMKKLPEIKDLFIDIGVGSKEEAKKLVQIGDYATFDTKFSESGDIIFGKALDDRIGCYMLIQLIKHTDLPIYCAFTVQEETGLRTARIVAYRISPQIAIAVDTTASGEWPIEKDIPKYPEIGKGCVITITDRSIICDKKLVSLLEETAKKNNIPYQFKRPMIGGTDAGPIHITREGIRTAVIQTPARYIHSPLSIASKKDIEAGIKLLTVSIQKILKEEALWS